MLEESLQNIFTTACSWSSFTISRTENLKYVYQTFIRQSLLKTFTAAVGLLLSHHISSLSCS